MRIRGVRNRNSCVGLFDDSRVMAVVEIGANIRVKHRPSLLRVRICCKADVIAKPEVSRKIYPRAHRGSMYAQRSTPTLGCADHARMWQGYNVALAPYVSHEYLCV